MATRTPVSIGQDWTLIYNGVANGLFSGNVQAAGNPPIVGRIVVGAGAPAVGAGGFQISSEALPITVEGTESFWCRTSNTQSAVVLF